MQIYTAAALLQKIFSHEGNAQSYHNVRCHRQVATEELKKRFVNMPSAIIYVIIT